MIERLGAGVLRPVGGVTDGATMQVWVLLAAVVQCRILYEPFLDETPVSAYVRPADGVQRVSRISDKYLLGETSGGVKGVGLEVAPDK